MNFIHLYFTQKREKNFQVNNLKLIDRHPSMYFIHVTNVLFFINSIKERSLLFDAVPMKHQLFS